MSIKLGDHIALGTDAKSREGVVVDASHGGGVLLVAWDDGRRTIIATEIVARLANTEHAEGTKASL